MDAQTVQRLVEQIDWEKLLQETYSLFEKGELDNLNVWREARKYIYTKVKSIFEKALEGKLEAYEELLETLKEKTVEQEIIYDSLHFIIGDFREVEYLKALIKKITEAPIETREKIKNLLNKALKSPEFEETKNIYDALKNTFDSLVQDFARENNINMTLSHAMPSFILMIYDTNNHVNYRGNLLGMLKKYFNLQIDYPDRKSTSGERYLLYLTIFKEFRKKFLERYSNQEKVQEILKNHMDLDDVREIIYSLRELKSKQSQNQPNIITKTIHPDKGTSKTEQLMQELFKIAQKHKNIILEGPPGTGKTYLAVEIAKRLTNNNKDQYRIVTFHPSLSYEDFIEGIFPETENGKLTYKVKPGIFKQICDIARLNKDKKFVLIIDEINRGDLSRIFGELITLIEDDKRDNDDYKATLTYSKEEFTVPENLYIIGTMNTADRSIALMDFALRRRFFFYFVKADPEILEEKGFELAAEYLRIINETLKDSSFGETHMIGHAFFLKPLLRGKEALNIEDSGKLPPEKEQEIVEEVMIHQVLPQIKEYFAGDEEQFKMFRKTLEEKLSRNKNT